MGLNKDKLDKLLETYPLLEILLQAGTVSNKIVREVLDIDRWLMEKIQRDLLLNGIVLGISSTTFKATQETINYIRSRKNE